MSLIIGGYLPLQAGDAYAPLLSLSSIWICNDGRLTYVEGSCVKKWCTIVSSISLIQDFRKHLRNELIVRRKKHGRGLTIAEDGVKQEGMDRG